MKRLFLSLISVIAFASIARAISTPAEWNYIPVSSFTDTTTGAAPVLFSSYPAIQLMSIAVTSGAAGSFVAFYRSTGSVWDPGLSTWVFLNTDYNYPQGGLNQLDLFDLKSTSFTWIQKVGNARIIMFYHCARPVNLKGNELIPGFCPGIPATNR